MARYHFHNAIDGSAVGDPDGEELPDLRAAEDMALVLLSEILPIKREEFEREKRFSVNVKDSTGRLVIALTTTMTVDGSPDPEAPPST